MNNFNMLLHYMLDENPGTHGLKQLSLKYTPYGDYEKGMYDWIDEYCRRTGILKGSFTWDMIPFDIMKDYAAMDAVCTFLLFGKVPVVAVLCLLSSLSFGNFKTLLEFFALCVSIFNMLL